MADLIQFIITSIGAICIAAVIAVALVMRYGKPPKNEDPYKGMYYGKRKTLKD